MTYENFLKVTLRLQKQDLVIQKIYENKVDLMDFVDPYHEVITVLLKEIYGEEGYDWWSWFCYENDYGNGTLEAWDENENKICYSHESLWEYMESIRNKNRPEAPNS